MSILPKLYISLFGEFSVSYEDKCINERSRRSPKMWLLLEYLIIFKDREISQNELVELLWNNETEKKPIGALKTQMHRLRNELVKLGINENVIINTHGSYAFNKAINYSIDTEEFEKLSRLVIKETDLNMRLNLIMKAVDLYKDDFLQKINHENWIIPLSNYYRSLFIRMAHEGVELLKSKDRPHEAITLCERTLLISPYDEHIHGILIEMLFKTGNTQGAMSHYNYIINHFDSQLGIKPSKELTAVYNSIINKIESKSSSFKEVINRLSKIKKGNGAFFCEYELFKHIYNLESRYMERHNRSVSLFLITLNGDLSDYSEEINLKMDKLGNAIKDSLRMSDIFARYSICQYIILLHDVLEHNYNDIIERIKIKFGTDDQNSFKSEFQLLEVSEDEIFNY